MWIYKNGVTDPAVDGTVAEVPVSTIVRIISHGFISRLLWHTSQWTCVCVCEIWAELVLHYYLMHCSIKVAVRIVMSVWPLHAHQSMQLLTSKNNKARLQQLSNIRHPIMWCISHDITWNKHFCMSSSCTHTLIEVQSSYKSYACTFISACIAHHFITFTFWSGSLLTCLIFPW